MGWQWRLQNDILIIAHLFWSSSISNWNGGYLCSFRQHDSVENLGLRFQDSPDSTVGHYGKTTDFHHNTDDAITFPSNSHLPKPWFVDLGPV